MRYMVCISLAFLLSNSLSAQTALNASERRNLAEMKNQVLSLNRNIGLQVHYDSERMSISVDSRVLLLDDFSHYIVNVIGSRQIIVFQYYYKSGSIITIVQGTDSGNDYYVRVSEGTGANDIRIRDGKYSDIKKALQHFIQGKAIKDYDKSFTLVANLVENGWFK